jgi:Phosphoribosylpyrophosphate synthetase
MFRGKADMRLLTGTAHPQLARDIADYLGVPLGDATVSSFPDGETFVKINENVRGRDVFIIQPTCPPTNQNLMELLILVDAARRASAARITAVIPFSATRGRTAKTSRGSRSRQSWSRTSSWPPG